MSRGLDLIGFLGRRTRASIRSDGTVLLTAIDRTYLGPYPMIYLRSILRSSPMRDPGCKTGVCTHRVPSRIHKLSEWSAGKSHQEKPPQLSDAMRHYDRLTALAISYTSLAQVLEGTSASIRKKPMQRTPTSHRRNSELETSGPPPRPDRAWNFQLARTRAAFYKFINTTRRVPCTV